MPKLIALDATFGRFSDPRFFMQLRDLGFLQPPTIIVQLTAHCCRLQLHLDKKKQIKKKMNKRKFVAKLQAAVITLTMLLFVLLVLSCIIYLFTITE